MPRAAIRAVGHITVGIVSSREQLRCIAAGWKRWPKRCGSIWRGANRAAQQAEKLARLVLLAQTARLWVETSRAAVELAAITGDNASVAVTQALLARQVVETACLDGAGVFICPNTG